jgi:hypothetical protein
MRFACPPAANLVPGALAGAFRRNASATVGVGVGATGVGGSLNLIALQPPYRDKSQRQRIRGARLNVLDLHDQLQRERREQIVLAHLA